MYTVSKGPSKIVAKTRRGLTQNYEKFETIKESGKKSSDVNSPENFHVPRPVFQPTKKSLAHCTKAEEEVLTPQHEEIIQYINDSWNIIVAHNPYDTNASVTTTIQTTAAAAPTANSSNNNCASLPLSSSSSTSSASASTASTPSTSPQPSASIYCVEPPSPVLSDFKPFDLESWWGRRLFNNITKSL